tara:strand:+ start:206 stop:2020 length:1815 start_codon:yes stop_codon:yes gene_type:complete
MSTIKINQLATGTVESTDFIITADGAGVATKNTIQDLADVIGGGTTDSEPTEGSTNAVQSGGVFDAFNYNKQINTVVKADSYPSIPADSVLWESYPKANLIVNIGFVYQSTVKQSFNFISARIWSAIPNTTVTAKVYKSSKPDYQFDPSDTVNATLLETLTFVDNFNISEDRNLNLLLSESYLIDVNEYIYVDFYCADGSLLINKSVTGNQKLLFREETYGGTNPYWSTTGWKSIGMTLFNQDNENFTKADLIENPNIEILIPNKINVAVGRELNIFKDNLIASPDNAGYSVQFINTTSNWTSISDNSGINNSKRGLRFTPTTSGQTWKFEVSVLDAQRKKVAVKNIEIITVSKTAGSGTINVLNFGDSITEEASGAYTQELKNLFDADGGVTANMIGTKTCLDGVSGYEGYSGQTLNFFLGASSPFWNGSEINFQDYCSTNGFGDIDYCQFMLGTNDVLSGIDYYPDYDNIVSQAKSIIDKLLSSSTGFPTCKILVGLESLGAYEGSLSPASRDSQILKAKLVKLNNLFIKEFQDGAYNSNVDVSPNHIWLDRTYGYPHTQVKVSDRADATDTELTYSDSVHQNSSGSKQYSDSIYSNIRKML